MKRLVVILAVLGTAGLAWLALRSSSSNEVGDFAKLGDRAPSFRAVNLRTGRPTTLADYKGKVILLNIWATWCPPCGEEMPILERLQKDFQSQSFQVVAVSIDDGDSSVVLAYAREHEMTFDVLRDPTGSIERRYGTIGVPWSFLIDRDGYIMKAAMGPASWDDQANEQIVRLLLTSARRDQ